MSVLGAGVNSGRDPVPPSRTIDLGSKRRSAVVHPIGPTNATRRQQVAVGFRGPNLKSEHAVTRVKGKSQCERVSVCCSRTGLLVSVNHLEVIPIESCPGWVDLLNELIKGHVDLHENPSWVESVGSQSDTTECE